MGTTLNHNLRQRLDKPEHLLIPMDQISQYRSSDYNVLLERHEIGCSLSTKGCCWVNTVSAFSVRSSTNNSLSLPLLSLLRSPQTCP